MKKWSVSYYDQDGVFHMKKPFFDSYEEAEYYAKHNFLESKREILPWSCDDDNPNFCYPLLDKKEILKPQKDNVEQLDLFDFESED